MRRALLLLGLVAACGGEESDPTAGIATGPAPLLRAEPLDFGRVVVGESASRVLVIENTSGLQFVTITGFTAPGPGVTITGPAPILPLTLAPGREHEIGLRYAPAEASGPFVQTLRFANGFETLFETTLRGEAIASELVTDFGDVPLDAATGETPDLALDLPPDAIALTIEATGGPEDLIIPVRLEGPGGRAYLDASDPWAGPYRFDRNLPRGFSAAAGRFAPKARARFQLPNSDVAAVQLVAGGGIYRVRLRLLEGTSATLAVRAVVERRDRPQEGHLDLNVFLAARLRPPPSVLDEAEAILLQAGISFGAIEVFDLPSAPADLEALFAEAARGQPGRLDLFFVDDLGGAASLGTAQPGGPGEAVAVAFGADGAAVARAIARFLGLFDLPEDLVADTPPIEGTSNLLDPARSGGPGLTAGQAHVLLRHRLVAPGPGR